MKKQQISTLRHHKIGYHKHFNPNSFQLKIEELDNDVLIKKLGVIETDITECKKICEDLSNENEYLREEITHMEIKEDDIFVQSLNHQKKAIQSVIHDFGEVTEKCTLKYQLKKNRVEEEGSKQLAEFKRKLSETQELLKKKIEQRDLLLDKREKHGSKLLRIMEEIHATHVGHRNAVKEINTKHEERLNHVRKRFDQAFADLEAQVPEKIKTYLTDYILELIQGNKERKLLLRNEKEKTGALKDTLKNLETEEQKRKIETSIDERIKYIIQRRRRMRERRKQREVKHSAESNAQQQQVVKTNVCCMSSGTKAILLKKQKMEEEKGASENSLSEGKRFQVIRNHSSYGYCSPKNLVSSKHTLTYRQNNSNKMYTSIPKPECSLILVYGEQQQWEEQFEKLKLNTHTEQTDEIDEVIEESNPE